MLVKLISTAGTGYFYVKARAWWRALAPAALAARAHPPPPPEQKKNPKKFPVKMEFMKYDPRVRMHVLFQESKMK